MRRIFSFFALLVIAGCGSFDKKSYSIGVDPSFFPMELQGKEANVFAFCNELLQELAKLKGVQFERVNTSWDNLLMGLREKKYQAMISPMPPLLFNKEKYDFSKLFLPSGPVLIVRQNADISSFDDLKGKEVAVEPHTEGQNIIEKDPDIITRFYDSIPIVLNEVVRGKIDGALVPYILAISYLQDLYRGRLKIVTRPLTNEGLRLITLKNENRDLLKLFSSGLKELKDDGKYDKLLEKWNVGLKY